MNSQLSLLEIVREQKKKRPLKIVCDWDECLQPLNPWVENEAFAKNKDFKKFFADYWEKAEKTFRSHGTLASNTNIPEIEAFRKQNPQKFREEYARVKKDYFLYDKAPFLSIAEELMLALKEGLIAKLLIVSSFREGLADYTPENFDPIKGDKRKIQKFQQSFAKFPETTIDISKIEKGLIKHESGKNHPYRWERIKALCPDFDIFIDDNNRIITKTREFFKKHPEKIYVMPDYKCNRHIQGSNIYRIKQEVSNLKKQDFTIATLESKLKQLKKEISDLKQQQIKSQLSANLWLIISILVNVILLFLLIIIFGKKKRKKLE